MKVRIIQNAGMETTIVSPHGEDSDVGVIRRVIVETDTARYEMFCPRNLSASIDCLQMTHEPISWWRRFWGKLVGTKYNYNW